VGPVDPGLTASTEGSPRPADQWSGHESREAYQDKVCAEISEKSCARSGKSASRDKGAWREVLRGRKSFHQGSVHGIARNWEKDCRGKEVGMEGRFFLEDMEVGGRRISIKVSRPHVVSSLFSTLSDGLRESCVSVTKLIFVSLVSSLSLVLALSLVRVRNSATSIDTYLQ
jgi:hypothetical protein